MWAAILLVGWFVSSLLVGPWIGRFVATHARPREEPLAPAAMSQNTEPAKPIPMVRRA